MTVYELTREQLDELKAVFLIETDDGNGVTWGEIAAAGEIVPDAVIYEHYDGVYFTEDDFYT